MSLECGAEAAGAPLSPGAQASGAPHAETLCRRRRSADCAARKKRCSARLRTALEKPGRKPLQRRQKGFRLNCARSKVKVKRTISFFTNSGCTTSFRVVPRRGSRSRVGTSSPQSGSEGALRFR